MKTAEVALRQPQLAVTSMLRVLAEFNLGSLPGGSAWLPSRLANPRCISKPHPNICVWCRLQQLDSNLKQI
ncbi:MAG: hypothetical protein DWI67_00960 [Chloroflexi bacterium]|nr:MAG: hypothetical protein DWI67_00960 [Chloroflexota bacterium]